MKKQIFTLAALSIFGITMAQDISTSQVPSVILNQFNKDFSKANDVDWEMEGNLYNVDFEMGWNIDHEVWYSADGKIIKHKEVIAIKELPKAVSSRINTDFKGYSIDDLERITENGKVVYKMELNSLLNQDWDVVVDASGKVLSKIAD